MLVTIVSLRCRATNFSQTSLLLMETLSSCIEMAESFGVYCVVKQSMDSPKRRKRSFRLYATHGRQKGFQYFRRSVLNIEFILRVFGIILSNYSWSQVGGKLSFASLRMLAPLLAPPPPHPPLGAPNNASGRLLYPRASTNVEGFLGRGGARRTSREEGGPQNIKNESGEENGIVELARPRAGSRTLMGLTALGWF